MRQLHPMYLRSPYTIPFARRQVTPYQQQQGLLIADNSTVITINFGTALNSLPTSSNFTAGAESDEVNNTSDKYLDAMLFGKIQVSSSAVTANTSIIPYLWGSYQSLASGALDTLDGTASTETLTSVGVLTTLLRQAPVVGVVDATTANRVYYFAPFSVAECLGVRYLPPYWGMFIAHNTGQNLASSGHEWKAIGYKTAY